LGHAGSPPLVTDHHRYIHANNSLFISQLTREDTGDYRCVASNMYNNASSSVHISIEDVFIPPGCGDSPNFANCDLIVSAQYCSNRYYAKFCCRSCFLSGQLDRNMVYANMASSRRRRRHGHRSHRAARSGGAF